MGQILGIGCSHGPGIIGPPETLTEIYLKYNLRSDLTPPHMKDPKNWPARMREEWADDEGMAYARAYQAKLQPAYRRAREAIDAFKPDFVLIFGDDQYEVFKEDLIPPFALFAIDEVKCGGSRGEGNSFIVKGNREAGNYLARGLIMNGFDVGCSWKLRNREDYGHAFTWTIQYLDQDGKGFDHPVIPFSINCYGSHMRIPRPNRPAIRGRIVVDDDDPPPPAPMPWRVYDMGKAVARIIQESSYRAVVIGSSSWSHASLTAKNHFLWPDIEADRRRLQELESGEFHKWRDLTPEEINDAGQHEILNWIALGGAMEGRKPEFLTFADCYIFNSEKTVCIFPVE
ncbi:MAG: Extradiol ring-cleavage dioxygenase [Chloroflexi bacterium]|nr:Extradiol ring-cleavage dioxygenase [Chloroflexota bacterium]